MNQGAPGALRLWPVSGRCQAELIRADTGELACVLATGYRNQATGEFYLWGLRRKGNAVDVVVADRNPIAVRGDSIRVVIDGSQLGSYPVTRRKQETGFSAATAELPMRDAGTITTLIRVGGSIKFITDDATYEAPLDGAHQGMANLDMCSQEAAQVNAAQRPPERTQGDGIRLTPDG